MDATHPAVAAAAASARALAAEAAARAPAVCAAALAARNVAAWRRFVLAAPLEEEPTRPAERDMEGTGQKSQAPAVAVTADSAAPLAPSAPQAVTLPPALPVPELPPSPAPARAEYYPAWTPSALRASPCMEDDLAGWDAWHRAAGRVGAEALHGTTVPLPAVSLTFPVHVEGVGCQAVINHVVSPFPWAPPHPVDAEDSDDLDDDEARHGRHARALAWAAAVDGASKPWAEAWAAVKRALGAPVRTRRTARAHRRAAAEAGAAATARAQAAAALLASQSHLLVDDPTDPLSFGKRSAAWVAVVRVADPGLPLPVARAQFMRACYAANIDRVVMGMAGRPATNAQAKAEAEAAASSASAAAMAAAATVEAAVCCTEAAPLPPCASYSACSTPNGDDVTPKSILARVFGRKPSATSSAASTPPATPAYSVRARLPVPRRQACPEIMPASPAATAPGAVVNVVDALDGAWFYGSR